MKTLIDTIARATEDPAERLLLAVLIVKEVREGLRTETRGEGMTYTACFNMWPSDGR